MIIKTAKELKDIVKRITVAAGADNRNANRLSEALVLANLKGVDTHGIYHLPKYVDNIKAGNIIPTNWPEIVKETSNYSLVKGNFTFGHVTAKFAMEIAIKKALKNDISIVSGVQVHHTGRIGEYVEMAVEKKLISFMFSGGCSDKFPEVMPYGGKKRILHTNPFAMGFPAGVEAPMISDYATTAISGSKISFARDKNQKLPYGCIVDSNGKPTNNPEDYFSGGAHLPFGGHKGYALILANEFLGRIFPNTELFIDLNKSCKHTFRKCGFTMIVFKPDLSSSYEEYAKSMDRLLKKIRNTSAAPGFDKVLIPGDIEKEIYEDRIKNGIPVENHIWDSIIESARSLGLKKI